MLLILASEERQARGVSMQKRPTADWTDFTCGKKSSNGYFAQSIADDCQIMIFNMEQFSAPAITCN